MPELLTGTKTCSKCSENKPLDQFNKTKRNKDGLQTWCRECTKQYKQSYYAEKSKDEAFRAAKNDRQKAKRWEDREKYLADLSEYRKKPSQVEYRKQYYQANKDRLAIYCVEYRKKNPNSYLIPKAKRRAQQRNNTIGVITPELLADRLAYYGYKCWICKTAPYEHIDHVKPLSKGGAHMLANLRPACADCNLKKSNKWPFNPKEVRND